MSGEVDNKLIIEGITPEGRQFRPSDWAERVCDSLSTFRNHRIIYSPLLRPAVKNGHKCVIIDMRLKESNPELYSHMLEFARANNLKICADIDEHMPE